MKTQTALHNPLLLALSAILVLFSLPAFGAEPAAEPAKASAAAEAKAPATSAAGGDTDQQQESPLSVFSKKSELSGGMDPHGDSWQSIKNSFQQFGNPQFVLRLFLSLSLAVGCAAVLAWHPRGAKRRHLVSEIEERKAFIILGVVGAVVAELSGTSATLAFVIFGIGALLRFRTVLDNPKATGKAILMVVIGLACGMGSWTMAVFVTAFSWGLIFWLDSHLTSSMTVRITATGDSKPIEDAVAALLASHGCRLQSCALSKNRKRLEFLFQMPAALDHEKLQAGVKAKLPEGENSQVTIELV